MKIVIDQHGIVVVDGGNGIEQRRHEIGFRIPNAGGVLADTVHDLFDVHGGDLFKALLHEAGGILRIPPDLDRMQLDELVEIMLEVAMNRSPTVKIGRDAEYPTGFVQQRFEKITSMHIEKVMDGIRENTTRVWNTKAYLMAALFNSVSTIDNHYAMLVNHDFHGGP